ncbi:MAG: hypothetical protein QOJ64_2692 [Acidobacteriota bacterium]|jgi:nucleoid-associated protein YgaU|nr:hypothetical protein [Acidobacteriota bacterium]
MGIFDQAFGTGVAKITDDVNFNRLKEKYGTVLGTIEGEKGRVQTLNFEGDKLVITAVVPSEDAKNKVWDQIKAVDAGYADLTADVTVDPSQGLGPMKIYAVKPGDSLWRIAQHELGDGTRYMEVFYANRDKMDTPQSVIHPGDQLNVPAS